MASLTFIYNLMASGEFAGEFAFAASRLAVGDKFISRPQSLKCLISISIIKDLTGIESTSNGELI